MPTKAHELKQSCPIKHGIKAARLPHKHLSQPRNAAILSQLLLALAVREAAALVEPLLLREIRVLKEAEKMLEPLLLRKVRELKEALR